MTKGILLIATGSVNYLRFAENLAVSIRANGYGGDICLGIDEELLNSLDYYVKEKCNLEAIEIDTKYTHHNNKFSPGYTKLNLDRISPFDQTLYLDVDAICIKDLTPLFELWDGVAFKTVCNAKFDVELESWSCQWMSFENVKKNYLPTNFKGSIPEINSSLMYFDKAKGKRVFEVARALFETPVHKSDFGTGWGNSFPDELAFNVSLGLNEFDVLNEVDSLIYFRIKGHKPKSGSKGTADNFDWIKHNYYLIGVFGDFNFNHFSITEDNANQGLYNKYQNIYCNQVLGRCNIWKIKSLMKTKHVLSK